MEDPRQLDQEEVVVHDLVALVAHFERPQEAVVVCLEVEHFDVVRHLVRRAHH